jgi:Uma2 family endonuclease
MATVAETLTSADEYLRMPDIGRPTELVRGKIVTMNPPLFRHGQVCSQTDRLVGGFAEAAGIGRTTCNDSGVITERDPDTVRGADVAFYSYERLPKDVIPEGYAPVAPDLVFEVLSPHDRWSHVLAKVAEYLNAGVTVVCVLDPQDETAQLYRADRPVQILTSGDELTIPEVLGDFRVPVHRFFQ